MAKRRRDVDEEWREQAACAPYDTRVFFAPAGVNDIDPTAADLCAACPVFEACLDYALRHDVQGTWAGTNTSGRRRLRRERGIRARSLNLDLTALYPDTPTEESA